jgi:hypothetical protein
MALGLALRAVDLPSRGVQVALAAVLVVLFFTHVFRYPFAVAGVLAAAAVTWPVHRRLAPALWPLAPSLVLFAVWWFVRPAGLTAGPIELSWEPARWKLLPAYVVQGFRDPRQLQIAERHLWIVAAVAALSLVLAFLRRHESTRESRRRALLAALVPVGGALALLALYFSLPMAIGVWWYAYPREATAFAVLALAAVPDLPRERWLRAVIVAALSGSALSASALVAHHYAAFERSGREFEAVARRVPQAPKLLYLVFDHSGSARTISPYVHLPAWIQAERGGWLGFHFSAMNASPLVYREDAGAVVPPRLPAGWEWMPNRFRLEEHGAFFDWFLVRSEGDPKALFSADPTIRPVAHEGRWWLFARGARQSAVTS